MFTKILKDGLKTPLTNQIVFDAIWEKFVIEGTVRDCVINNYSAYRHSPTGCFLGFLFSEEFADALEKDVKLFDLYSFYKIASCYTQTFYQNSKTFPEFVKAFENCDFNFLESLQEIHDFSDANANIEKRLEQLITKGWVKAYGASS